MRNRTFTLPFSLLLVFLFCLISSVSFAKDFDAEMRTQIVDALLKIAGTEEGQAALENLYSIANLVAADDTFYDTFRADLSKAGMDIEELTE